MNYQDLPPEVLLLELIKRDKQLMESDLMRMALQAHHDRMNQIVKTTPVGICITDEGGFIEQINPAWCDLFGYRAEELVGRHFTLILPENKREELSRLHDRFMEDGTSNRGEWVAMTKPGHEITVLVEVARIVGADERPKRATYILDITEKKAFEAQLQESNRKLEELVRTDSLTGLLNHRTVIEELVTEIRRFQRLGDPLSILMLDLDNFKGVNDTYGHLVGDMVLQVASNCINSCIRNIDLVGRYGGEEFLVALPDATLQDACEVAERIREKVEAHRFKQGFKLTISIGAAEYSEGSAQDLIDAADQQLYRAKKEGKNRVCCTTG